MNFAEIVLFVSGALWIVTLVLLVVLLSILTRGKPWMVWQVWRMQRQAKVLELRMKQTVGIASEIESEVESLTFIDGPLPPSSRDAKSADAARDDRITNATRSTIEAFVRGDVPEERLRERFLDVLAKESPGHEVSTAERDELDRVVRTLKGQRAMVESNLARARGAQHRR